jgi:tRNA (mo5U34)-methyltransferase
VDDLRSRVDAVTWFHTIDLGNGIVTPGRDDSASRLARMQIPDDLTGMSVLDVGAWDGYFSFEAERRGAGRVVAIDPGMWRSTGDNGWTGKSGFELARRTLRSGVEDVDIELGELGPERLGTFDVVLFLGVFYHLRDPLPILERVASVTAEQLILETHADLLGMRRPAMAYYAGSEVSDDESNFWGPNAKLLEALLRDCGFNRMEIVYRESLPYRLARSAYRRVRGDRLRAQQGRLVIHAHR